VTVSKITVKMANVSSKSALKIYVKKVAKARIIGSKN
jgi:hypothetical protein